MSAAAKLPASEAPTVPTRRRKPPARVLTYATLVADRRATMGSAPDTDTASVEQALILAIGPREPNPLAALIEELAFIADSLRSRCMACAGAQDTYLDLNQVEAGCELLERKAQATAILARRLDDLRRAR